MLYGCDMTVETRSTAGPVTGGHPTGSSGSSLLREQPTYHELLRLSWTLLWRGAGSFVLLMFAGNVALLFLFPELTRTVPTFWVALLPLAVATLISAFLLMPFIMRRFLKARFKGFHVSFVRDRCITR